MGEFLGSIVGLLLAAVLVVVGFRSIKLIFKAVNYLFNGLESKFQ